MIDCFECGIVRGPLSLIFPDRCNSCADWVVFDAMLECEWFVHEQSAQASWHMALNSWYEALGDDGVPLGYQKPHDTYYPPYAEIVAPVNESLTAPAKSAIMVQPVTTQPPSQPADATLPAGIIAWKDTRNGA